jgi:hypothetical protein
MTTDLGFAFTAMNSSPMYHYSISAKSLKIADTP